MNRKKININNRKIELKNLKTYIMIGLCAVMAVLTIFLTIESSTNGAEFANLQKKELQLLSQQQDLQQSLVESLSVNNLQEKSSGLGYAKISNLIYVSNTASVANSEPVAKLP